MQVIPVEMTEEYDAGKDAARTQRAGAANTSTGVEQQRGRIRAVVREREARGVAPVAHEVEAGGRRRSSNAQKMNPHAVSPRSCLRADVR